MTNLRSKDQAMNRRQALKLAALTAAAPIVTAAGFLTTGQHGQSIIVIRSIKRYGFAGFKYGIVAPFYDGIDVEYLLGQIKAESAKYSLFEGESDEVVRIIRDLIDYRQNEAFHPFHEDGGSVAVLMWPEQLEFRTFGLSDDEAV